MQIGESAAIRDDILEGLDVCIIDRGVLDIAKNSVRNGEPDFRSRIASGAEAILACQVEVRERSWTISSGARW